MALVNKTSQTQQIKLNISSKMNQHDTCLFYNKKLIRNDTKNQCVEKKKFYNYILFSPTKLQINTSSHNRYKSTVLWVRVLVDVNQFIYCVFIWCVKIQILERKRFTIKYFQFVKLFLTLEHFHIDGDGEGGQNSDDPRAGLRIGVVFWKAGTQDHPRGSGSLFIGRTLSCSINRANAAITAISSE